MAGITLDTGVLIGLEHRKRSVLLRWQTWLKAELVLTVPAVVVAEWWRGQRGPVGRFLQHVDVEPLTDELAHVAGVALGELELGREHTIDAIVMASAAQRGDIVYTSDFDDLSVFGHHFRIVRVLAF